MGYSLFNTIQTPNDSQYRFGSCRFGNPTGGLDHSNSACASSQHSGGVNVCMGDGSVKFIKDSISRDTWWAIGTRDGGEVGERRLLLIGKHRSMGRSCARQAY